MASASSSRTGPAPAASSARKVTRAPPDGYTFVISSLGSFVINPVFTPAPFDPFKDFTHIAYLGGQPVVLFASKDLPYRRLRSSSPTARTHPGAHRLRHDLDRIADAALNEQFQQRAGIKMTHVPYRGAGQIVTDVLGGHLATGLVSLAAAAGQSVEDRARARDQHRGAAADLSGLPTYKEQGYPDIVASTWFALSGPANLPRDIVDRLNAEVVKALQAPDVCRRVSRARRSTPSRSTPTPSRLLQGRGRALDAARQGGGGAGQGRRRRNNANCRKH